MFIIEDHISSKEYNIMKNVSVIGLAALKAVLNKFAVINRKNMFVIKESTTQAVFYLR